MAKRDNINGGHNVTGGHNNIGAVNNNTLVNNTDAINSTHEEQNNISVVNSPARGQITIVKEFMYFRQTQTIVNTPQPQPHKSRWLYECRFCEHTTRPFTSWKWVFMECHLMNKHKITANAVHASSGDLVAVMRLIEQEVKWHQLEQANLKRQNTALQNRVKQLTHNSIASNGMSNTNGVSNASNTMQFLSKRANRIASQTTPSTPSTQLPECDPSINGEPPVITVDEYAPGTSSGTSNLEIPTLTKRLRKPRPPASPSLNPRTIRRRLLRESQVWQANADDGGLREPPGQVQVPNNNSQFVVTDIGTVDEFNPVPNNIGNATETHEQRQHRLLVELTELQRLITLQRGHGQCEPPVMVDECTPTIGHAPTHNVFNVHNARVFEQDGRVITFNKDVNDDVPEGF